MVAAGGAATRRVLPATSLCDKTRVDRNDRSASVSVWIKRTIRKKNQCAHHMPRNSRMQGKKTEKFRPGLPRATGAEKGSRGWERTPQIESAAALLPMLRGPFRENMGEAATKIVPHSREYSCDLCKRRPAWVRAKLGALPGATPDAKCWQSGMVQPRVYSGNKLSMRIRCVCRL